MSSCFLAVQFWVPRVAPALSPYPDQIKIKRSSVKLWPNGDASRRKLSTCVYLRLRLARTCVHFRWLAFTLIKIKFARKYTQVFHRLATQRKSTQVFFCLLRVPNCSPRRSIQMAFLTTCVILTCKYTCEWASPFGNQTQVCTQVHILKLASTCVSAWAGL